MVVLGGNILDNIDSLSLRSDEGCRTVFKFLMALLTEPVVKLHFTPGRDLMNLAAGQSHVRQRNADIAAFLEDKELFPESHETLPYVNGGDGSTVLDHEMVFVSEAHSPMCCEHSLTIRSS